jgi:AcrR family transcriptional regulator
VAAKATEKERDEALGTRDRILDIAQDLFCSQGYDKTSLRQIADELGFSKAAIYYHFESKDDILLALHMRIHDFGKDALTTLEEGAVSAETWASLLDQLVDQMVEHRQLFLLHERNQAAFEALHDKEHTADHDDLHMLFRKMLSNPQISLRNRVRMSCSFGAVMSVLVLTGDVFADVDAPEMSKLLRDAIADLMGVDSSTAADA